MLIFPLISSMMISFSLIRDLFVSPGKVFQRLSDSKTGVYRLTIRLLMPLLLIPATTLLLGWALIGKSTSGEFFQLVEKGWPIGIEYALVYVCTTLCTLLASTQLIVKVTPAFRGVPNIRATFMLVLFAWIPVLLSGVFLIIPRLFWLQLPFLMYAFILIRIGSGSMIRIPVAARTVYTITAAFIITSMLALSFLLSQAFFKLILFH